MWDFKQKAPIVKFIGLTFIIAWVAEILMIVIEQTQLFGLMTMNSASESIMMILLFFALVIAGASPCISMYIILKQNKQLTGLNSFISLIFTHFNMKTVGILLLFFGNHLMLNFLTENYLGEPWYLFILMLPLLILGGGLEEIGWRGFLQPALEQKLNFFLSTVCVGVIWAFWHIPLFFIQSGTQSAMNFISFLVFCVVASFIFAVLYKLTKSVFAVVLLHAFSNICQSMFTRQGVEEVLSIKLLVIYAIEIILSLTIIYFLEKRNVSNKPKI